MAFLYQNEELLRSNFTRKRYEQLKRFMVNIWQSKAKYKVFMARRAFNLNYAFWTVSDIKKDKSFTTDNIMSNTALLLCAEDLAEDYLNTNSFPNILIVDDLLLHGRGIIRLLYSLENLIVEFIRRKNIEVQSSVIHEKMISSVNIYVFAQNKVGILLDRRYALKSEQYLPQNELRELSQQISSALQTCNIANTSYVLSVELPLYYANKLHYDNNSVDSSFLFQYRGNSQLYYYRYNCNILETIRTNCSPNNMHAGNVFTSLVLFGDISTSNFNELCRCTADEIRHIIPYSRISEILCYDYEELTRPKAQMLSLLLSIWSFIDFYKEQISTDIEQLFNILMQSDYRKIASNFGKASTVQYELTLLLKNICFNNIFTSKLFERLSKHTQSIYGFSERHLSSCFKPGNLQFYQKNTLLYETAEDIFYEVGINAECAAFRYVNAYEKFDPLKPGSDAIQLNQYLSIMNSKGIDSAISIGCVLGLMDSGLLAMNLEQKHDSEGCIQCILKAGELATFVLPRRFSVFIPALAIVEREYLKRGTDLKSVISRFIDYLQDHCYKQNGISNENDITLLKKLSTSKSSLLYMYVAGQSFQEWDTNLLTKGDRESNIERQYGGNRISRNQYQTELIYSSA